MSIFQKPLFPLIRPAGVIVKPQNLGKQGGSTITQQLIKNLTDEKQVTVARKFNEILSALNLERYFEKDEILEAYLNTIYLSEGCYGVKTAAEEYFGKDVADLNIAECACIAGITQFPTKYDPLINTEENKRRQKQVLGAMLEEGAITQEQYDEAVNYKLIFTIMLSERLLMILKIKAIQTERPKLLFTAVD